jgi:RNA polymerase sigma-70 factor (ECF subfamily)
MNQAVMDDDAIKAVARQDRRAAADLIVRKYRDRLFHHASYILKDYQQAMDVTQDVFIKAMREDRFFDEGFKMKAWLFRVTSNLCFNIRRDKKRRAAILETVDRPTSTAPDQVELVFSNQASETMMAALDKLSENHRKILMLRYYSDLSYAEIAATLDIKLGTVMSRLSRAKHQLVDVLDDIRETDA